MGQNQASRRELRSRGSLHVVACTECIPTHALMREHLSQCTFDGCGVARTACDPTFCVQIWAAPGRAHYAPARRPSHPICAGSVDDVVQLVHRLVRRVVGVCCRSSDDAGDLVVVVVQACPSLPIGSGDVSPGDAWHLQRSPWTPLWQRSVSNRDVRRSESGQHAVDK